MNLFDDAAALERSGYLFRITDNGGETFDRITVTTCDGDALACTLHGICAHIESVDPQRDAEDVEDGTARDLRWIDLTPELQRNIIADLNSGFADYLDDAPALATRDEARNWQGLWSDRDRDGKDVGPIYIGADGKFYIRDDDRQPPYDDGEPGPFETFREAVFYMLPQDYDNAGPEYHSTVDLWSDEGGPTPPWDRDAEPPTPYEVAAIMPDPNYRFVEIGDARDEDHARELAAEWREANPTLSAARITMAAKSDRTFKTLEGA